jgi:hypothetical protein
MTQTSDAGQGVEPLTHDERMTALLDATGDLDKAQVLHDRLPGWMVKASAQVLQDIEQAYAAVEPLRKTLRRRLGQLKPLDAFCAERLKALLLAKGFATLDIEHDTLELPRLSFTGVNPDLGGMLIETVTVEKHSLLQAAMQNFSQAAATPGGVPIRAVVRIGRERKIAPDLSALDFIGYCRELNLGHAYQTHIREVFNLQVPTQGTAEPDRGYNPVVREVGDSRGMDMQIDLHVAHGKGDIDQATRTLLLDLIRSDLPASQTPQRWFDNQPLTWQGLNVKGACLWGVLVFSSAAAEGFASGPIVVYMPNEPVRPWYRYESLEQWQLYLRLKLQVAAYRSFFMGYLDESERFGFFQRFDQDKTLGRVESLPVTSNLSTYFFNACVGKIQLDARVLAVPNAQVDDTARRERIQNFMDAGLTVLNVAALVVPVLGQLMMGVAVAQIIGEVFEGVEDWEHKDKLEAFRHLTNVAQNLASMALFAAGAQVVGRLWRSMPSASGFYAGVEAVRMPDKTMRLWRRRIEPYRHTVSLEGRVASPRGVYQANGQSYVNINGSVYSPVFDAQTSRWRARHPLRESAYRLPLSHNNQGGWQFWFERAHEWRDPDYILERMDPSLASFTADQRRDIALITDTDVQHLQQLSSENLTLPERVRECARRFRHNQHIRDAIWQMEHQAPLDPMTSRVQMQALPLMEGWPRGRFFELLDREGYVLERHPDTAPFDYDDACIHLTTQQLREGQVLSTLLYALDTEETAQLLGASVEPAQAHKVLTERLADSLKDTHQSVYEGLRARDDVHDQTDHGLLKSRYPQLPIRVAWELMTRASTAERFHLRYTRRVPLRLGQLARETLALQAEDEALSGLYLPELASPSTRRLAAGLLRQVPGWPADLLLQVRHETLRGDVLVESGDAQAAITRTVVQTAKGFRAYDEVGKALGAAVGGPEAFYTALLDCLSAEQLNGLNLAGNGRASRLRYAVIAKAQDERTRIARYLWPERAVPEETAASCIQAMPAAPQPHPVGLVRKVKKLYPLFDEQRISTFLQQLGSEHLSRAKAVRALEQQYEALRHALKQWTHQKVARARSDQAVRDYRLARHQAAEAIKHAWRQKNLVTDELGRKVPGLSLDGMAVGELPSLPAEVQLEAIEHLSLKRMGLNDDVAYFLKHFKGLRSLELTGNRVTRLPQVLQQMKHLRRLYLDNNQLQLTEYTRTKLADLRTLTVLNLNDNPLLDPPSVSKMFELETLALRSCRLKSLPTGFTLLPGLKSLDLRENDIASLPAWLFDANRDKPENINLGRNPLDAETRRALSAYRDKTGVGMGFVEDDIAQLNELKAKALWLGDERVADYPQKIETWAGLRDEPGSDALFTLLAGLGDTADSQHVHEDLNRRVWSVLNTAAADVGLRNEVFERAATPLNCDDAAAASFSNLELLVQVHQAMQRVKSGTAAARPLLRLGKGQFRLSRLESLAARHSAEHAAVDPLEVSLAYRTGLVGRLYLPGQPRHMRYASLAGVTEHMLALAEAQVKDAELSPDLLKYLVKLPYWESHLKKSQSATFDTLNKPFRTRLEAVFEEHATLGDAAYMAQLNKISSEQKLAESNELERLTLEALKHDELGICELPTAG